MSPVDEMAVWKRARNDLFRAPTLDAARKFLPAPPGGWLDPEGPLAAVHKARLQWLEASNAELAESVEWLTQRGYSTNWDGVPALTPERRDAERTILGQGPLKEKRS